MSITSRQARDDELLRQAAELYAADHSYEGQQYRFANQLSEAGPGTSFGRHQELEARHGHSLPLFVDDHHVSWSGPFAGVELGAVELPEREPTHDELLSIEEEITGHHWTAPEVHEVGRCGTHGDHCGEGTYCYPLNDYPPIPV